MMLMFKALPTPSAKKKAADDFHKNLKAQLGQDKPAAKQPQVDLSHPNFVGLLALLKTCAAGGEFGPHNVSEGDNVAFTAGAFNGSGEVSAAGEHGATVADDTGREHRVHWHEVTAHTPGKKKAGDGK